MKHVKTSAWNAARGPGQTMRLHLRAATQDDHDRVDRLYSGLDFKRARDRTRFLMANAMAYRRLLGEIAHDSEMWTVLDHNIALLTRDLSACGMTINKDLFAMKRGPDMGLGARYVICGSSLGKRVLMQRWADSTTDPIPAFLTETSLSSIWPQVLHELKHGRFEHVGAETLIAQARSTFGIFEAAFHASEGPMTVPISRRNTTRERATAHG